MKGEVVTSKKGIADVLGELYGKLYDEDRGSKVRTEAAENEEKKKHKLKEMKAWKNSRVHKRRHASSH